MRIFIMMFVLGVEEMVKDLNDLIEYLEEHLLEEISIKELSMKIGISEYHLKRTFSFIAGMSIVEYIRNRKLSLANVDLLKGRSVTEVAFKYGYNSIEGFSRGFYQWCGYLPSEIKKLNFQKSFPKLTFYITVKGGISMEFKIEKKESFNLVGVAKKVSLQFEGVNEEIVALAKSITEKQKKEMQEIGDLYPKYVVNASYDFTGNRIEEKGGLTHLIGYLSSKENPYEDLEQVKVPAHTWAIFPVTGKFPEKMQETWGNIFAQWLPSSDYEVVEVPEISFTKYSDTDETYSEIWIAVKEKN